MSYFTFAQLSLRVTVRLKTSRPSSTRNQTGDSVLTKAPDGLAYTNDYINQAIEQAKAAGVDVTGSGFQPATVALTEGGA